MGDIVATSSNNLAKLEQLRRLISHKGGMCIHVALWAPTDLCETILPVSREKRFAT